MKLRFVLYITIFFAFTNISNAQLLQWNTFGNAGTETTEPSVFNNANIAATNLTLGPGVTPAANANRFGGSNWFDTGDTFGTTLAESIAGNDYIQFVVTPNVGFSFTPASFVFQWDRSASGPANVVLRSSADGYVADLGIVAPAAAMGTSNTITISGLTNITSATTFRLYGYGATGTAGTGGFDVATNVVNVQLNGTTAPVLTGITSAQNGDWELGSTWVGGVVPTSAQNVIINHTVSAYTAITRDAGVTTQINSTPAGTLIINWNTFTNNGTMNVLGSFQINSGSATGNNFDYGPAGTLLFNTAGNYNLNNTDVFWPAAVALRPFNVKVMQSGITLASNMSRTVDGLFYMSYGGVDGVRITLPGVLLLNGICQIDTGGFFFGNSPTYGPASTLNYNTAGVYGRAAEWTYNGVGTIGVTPGYPNNVWLTNGTTLNYTNGTPLAKAMAGNLTIDPTSSFSMDYGFVSAGGTLTVAGNINCAGNLSLGFAVGDDLRLGGNLWFTGAGQLMGNNRAIFFTNSATQTISSVQPLTIPYIVYQPPSGSKTIQLLSDLTISAGAAGSVISFGGGGSDIFDINGHSLTLGTIGVANSIANVGTFKGSTTSNLEIRGLGSIGNLGFTAGFQNLGTFNTNREGLIVSCVLTTPVTISTSLVIMQGLINLGNNPMTLGAAATVTGNGPGNGYVISDISNGASASLRKVFTAAGNFTFPIGDMPSSLNGSDYSPITVTFTGGSYAANAYAGVAVQDLKHPNLDASTDYITRYWDVATSGITAPTAFTATATYTNFDVVGTEANSLSNKWNGAAWSNAGAPVNTAANTLTIPSLVVGATNQVTAGLRNAEINVKVVATNYLTGSTYDFGTQLTGSNTPVTFTIESLGQQSLNLASAIFSGGPVYVYTTPYANGPLAGPAGTRTFVVTFSPVAAGTFTGSITIPSNDPDENPYIINFTGIGATPAPEMNVKGFTGGTNNITDGSVVVSGLNNTLFIATTIGSSTTKDYEIQNVGSATLTLSGVPLVSIGGANPGDFAVTTVPAMSSIGVGLSTTFIITFTPQASGVRTAIVSISNNDSDENPYNYLIQGSGTCAVTSNTITPLSGPVNTEVTITATTNNLSGASASFNGVPAVVTQISPTQITVIVPAGATTGNLVTTNAQGCTASNSFTVIENAIASCQGGPPPPIDLFFSEVTDANVGGLSYVEIYNPTAAAVNLNTGGYQLQVANNGGTYSYTLVLTGTIGAGSTYVVALGDDNACGTPGGDGSYGAQSTGAGGVNFSTNQHDHIALFKASGATQVDSWGTFGAVSWAPASIGVNGVTYRRKKTTAILPNTTFSNADWDIIDFPGASCASNDYSDIGIYDFSRGIPPTVVTQPTFTPSCKAVSLTVVGAEGFAGGNTLAYQWYAVAPNVTTWTMLTNGGVYSGVATATLNISNIAGLDDYQFYVRIMENGATCYIASNAVKIDEALVVTWDGTSWSPSVPTSSNIAVINGNYNTSANGSIDACSLSVNGGFTLAINAGNYVSLQNDLTVNATGTLQVLDDASLVMIEDAGVVTNNGTMQVQKTTSLYNKFDYTYWSSPVTNATIGGPFSSWRLDYAFQFATPNYADVIAPFNGFDDNNDAWQMVTSGTSMVPGKGYAIMAPTTGTFPTSNTVTFSGAVNNGIISIPLAMSGNGASNTDDFNLIGNPYPSAIFADTFIAANPNFAGTLYFWTHRTGISSSNPGPDANNFITADYAMYNYSGGVGTGTSSGAGSPTPTGYVASGQGFFVDAQSATNVVFNNSMRSKLYNNSNFYRYSAAASPNMEQLKDRIWLNLQNEQGLFSQQLVGYFPTATLGFDQGYDGVVNPSSNTVSFYSFIDEKNYRIQGRPPFTDTDVVPLGYSSSIAGSYSVSIDHAEGLLNSPDTEVFLEDQLLGIIHDLKQASYVFTTAVGTFNDRFMLRYTNNALSVMQNEIYDNQVLAFAECQNIIIKSQNEKLKSVEIHDVLGHILFKDNNIDTNEVIVNQINSGRQVLIISILTESGNKIVKKIIF